MEGCEGNEEGDCYWDVTGSALEAFKLSLSSTCLREPYIEPSKGSSDGSFFLHTHLYSSLSMCYYCLWFQLEPCECADFGGKVPRKNDKGSIYRERERTV